MSQRKRTAPRRPNDLLNEFAIKFHENYVHSPFWAFLPLENPNEEEEEVDDDDDRT